MIGNSNMKEMLGVATAIIASMQKVLGMKHTNQQCVRQSNLCRQGGFDVHSNSWIELAFVAKYY